MLMKFQIVQLNHTRYPGLWTEQSPDQLEMVGEMEDCDQRGEKPSTSRQRTKVETHRKPSAHRTRRTTEVKYLRVNLDTRLIFSRHVEQTRHKAIAGTSRLNPLIGRQIGINLKNKLPSN